MATTLSQSPLLAGQDVYVDSATQLMPLGTYMETNDGRGFRYVKVGVTATVAGKAYQSPAEDTTNLTLSGGHTIGVVHAIGATTITTTNTITLTVNQLAGGYMSVNKDTGAGQLYKIKGNAACTGAVAVIYLEDPLRVALDATSNIIFLPSPWNGIVIDPGSATGNCVGVAQCVITGGQYGWIQTKGPASALFTGTGVAGKAVGLLTSGTSGSLAPAIAGTQIVGHNMGTSITGEYALINLTLG